MAILTRAEKLWTCKLGTVVVWARAESFRLLCKAQKWESMHGRASSHVEELMCEVDDRKEADVAFEEEHGRLLEDWVM